MKKLIEEWIGSYYPNEIITNPRSKAILCLLFDKIICHFPISDMACGCMEGISDDFRDNPLVKEGILELKEEVFLDEIEPDYTDIHDIKTEEFEEFMNIQIASMALKSYDEYGAIPVTDDLGFQVPASSIENNRLLRFARLQAVALATQSLEVTIPPIAEIPELDILEARSRLNEQLVPFRCSMLTLAPTVRAGLESGATLADVYNEARYIIETNIAPAFHDLQNRLSRETGRFWRRLLIKGSVVVPKFFLNWATKGALSATIESLGDIKELGLDSLKYRDFINILRNQGGLGYLLAVSNYPSFKSKCLSS